MKNVIILLIMLCFSSCLGTKKITETTASTKQVEKVEVKKDSASTVSTNQEIKDRIIVNVPKADNEETKKLLDAVLNQLNTSKSSGTNSYVSRYDEETRQLVVDFLVAQTQNKTTETNNDVQQETSFEAQTDQYIKKKITALPWWVYIIVVLVFRKQLLGFVAMFFPQIKAAAWFTRIVS